MPCPISPPPTTPICVLCMTEVLSGRIPAVDIHDLPGAEIRRRREEIERHADQVLDLAEPAERDARQRAGFRLLADRIVAVHPGGELGAKYRGRDSVHGD